MEPKTTISKVKSIHLMEGKVHETSIGYGFTGLILQLEDGRMIKHCSTDPMQQWNEITPSNSNYEQLKSLLS